MTACPRGNSGPFDADFIKALKGEIENEMRTKEDLMRKGISEVLRKVVDLEKGEDGIYECKE